eukprot:EG_transcript_8476
MSPHNAPTSSDAKPEKSSKVRGQASTKTPVDADIRVCLDFIKGRCTRPRCKFHHPEMAEYQQLSGAVQAQAGKQICEVWAMAGTCKFGAKCNKLHPIVLSQPSQTPLAMPLPMPLVAVPQPKPASPTATPQRRPPARQPRQSLVPLDPPSPSTKALAMPCGASPTASEALRRPFSPLHVAPALAGSPGTLVFEADAEAEFQDLAQSILKVLEAEEEWTPTAAESGKTPAAAPGGRSFAARLGMDRVFLDILSDLNVTAC